MSIYRRPYTTIGGKKGEIFKILPIARQLVHCSDGELDVWNKWDVIVGIL